MIDTSGIRYHIFQYAFSGKLTNHEDTDGTALDLLNKLNKEKDIVQKSNLPYDIPDYWAWVKLSDLYSINPKVKIDDHLKAAFISMEKIGAGFRNEYSYDIQSWKTASKNHTKFMNDDVAFAKISPCFENRKSFVAANLPNGVGGGTTELIVLRQKQMVPMFTYYVVNDQRFVRMGISTYKGIVGQQRVKMDAIRNYLVAVPPYAEQLRIVEQIEKIFGVLDRIDELQSKYSSDLNSLTRKIIDAGIRGKLTEQLPEDGTAEELYQQIQNERCRQEKEGTIKAVEPFSLITKDDMPFSIPNNWMWTRFGNIAYIVRGGSPRPIKQYMTSDSNGINWIKIGDVEKGGKYIEATKEKIIPEGERRSRKVYPGDFLLTNSMSFGRPYISKIEGCIHDGWLLVRNLKGFDTNYLYYLLSSFYIYNQFCQKASGSTVDNLNIEKVKSAVIPLPPLAEQIRIADKIEELLQYCR